MHPLRSLVFTEGDLATNGTEEEKEMAQVVRKSARLRKRQTPEEEDKPKEEKVTSKKVVKVKQEPASGGKEMKDEPKEKVEDGRQGSAKVDDRVTKEEPQPVKEEEQRDVKSESSDSSDSGDSSEDETDEDPDRLWCICRQPHDDR